jgi:amino-acid N-acetyltransferase
MFEAIEATSPELIAALVTENMPASDLVEPNRRFWRKLVDEQAVGYVGLEVYGDAALLRSLTVLPEHKGSGYGRDLVGSVVEWAKGEGITTLWLLTMTAQPFFEHIGWQVVERVKAPTAILRTGQFLGLCPSSATCMSMQL